MYEAMDIKINKLLVFCYCCFCYLQTNCWIKPLFLFSLTRSAATVCSVVVGRGEFLFFFPFPFPFWSQWLTLWRKKKKKKGALVCVCAFYRQDAVVLFLTLNRQQTDCRPHCCASPTSARDRTREKREEMCYKKHRFHRAKLGDCCSLWNDDDGDLRFDLPHQQTYFQQRLLPLLFLLFLLLLRDS